MKNPFSIIGAGSSTPGSDPSDGGTKLYNIARSAWELKRAGIGYYPSVADNGDGKIRITCVGHGLITGDLIDIHDSSVAGYNGTGLEVTRISADTFDIEATAYSATATGYWYCSANVFKASDQDGAKVPGSLVRSIYVVNMPNVAGTPDLFAPSDLVRHQACWSQDGTYGRDNHDPLIGFSYSFVQILSNGGIKWFSNVGAHPAGALARIDFVA